MAFHDFNPNFKGKHVCKAGDDATDFPFEEIYSRLDGEACQREDMEMSKDELVAALERIIAWMIQVRAHDQRGVKSAGIKTLAAAWVINPKFFGDSPAHMVAKSWGLYHQAFSRHAADFSRQFRIKNRFQAHDWQNKASPKKKDPPNFSGGVQPKPNVEVVDASIEANTSALRPSQITAGLANGKAVA